MILVHYGRSPKFKLRSRRQTHLHTRSDKPCGLWVSVEDANLSWREWCEAESFGCGKYPFRIHLRDDANILVLDTDDKILEFGEQYHKPPDGIVALKGVTWWLDWMAIVSKFQGIIISPYSWALRLDHRCSWYYGWDCASGVIWDKRAIARVES